ncbi:hypothetical protein EJB05_20225, partial [Eragrostis curvula]
MEAAAADLLAALSSPSSHAGLHSRFAAYLEPFAPHLPSSNPNPKPPPKRTTKQNKQQPPPPPDSVALRPLAKRFLSFLARALQLLPPLVRKSPVSGDRAEGAPTSSSRSTASSWTALRSYLPALRGSPTQCFSSAAALCAASSRADTSPALRLRQLPPLTPFVLCSLQRPRAPSRDVALQVLCPSFQTLALPGTAGTDPEVTTLAVELTVCLANCASKGKVKEVAPYERVLSLVQQLQPWLRIVAEDVSRKYSALLVNAMSRCTFFLVAESSFFDADLVHGFGVATLKECVKAQMIDHFLAVARKVCSLVDLSWAGSTRLLLDMLKIVIDSVTRVKVDLPKIVNEFLSFVAYFSRSLISANKDVRIGASELLYKQGGCFSEVYALLSFKCFPSLCLNAPSLCDWIILSTEQAESEESSFTSADILDSEKYLQVLNKALGALAQFFCVINGKSIPLHSSAKDSRSLMHQGHPHKKYSYPQSNDNISFVAYLDSLEFVCKMLLLQANTIWNKFSDGKATHYSGNTDHVLTALHQFIDSSLAAYSCSEMSEGDNERLHEQRRTLLKALVSAIKVSFVTNKDVQKSLSSINCAVSSTWLTLEELNFFISSLGNIGVTLHNTGHLEEAPKALELCCETIWAHTRLSYCRLSAKSEGNRSIEDPLNYTLRDIIVDAFTRIAKMIDTLHRCGAKMTREIIVKSLSELLPYGNMSEYFNSSLILIKLWVKTTCKDFKDFKDDQGMHNVPLLYHSLLSYPSPLPKKLVGLIVEQELLSYGLIEALDTTFCAKMQMRIVDILLDEIYCSKEYYLERSRVLVRKAGAFRVSGVKHIHNCLECLSEAISLLDSSHNNTAVINQLAIAYCLHAHCAQEANLDGKVILENAENAYKLWSKMEIVDPSSPGMVFEQPSKAVVPLLCSLVDLLAMKGCFELQFDLCKLMIKIWKRENLPLEKLFSSLFTSGRLSHACCHIPMDQQFISYVAEHLGIDCQHTEFWRNCFKGDLPSLAMFLQKMLCSDLFFSPSCECSIGRLFSFDASVDEVNKVASSLVSEVNSDDQSSFVAGHLYYDLSERLFSGGQLFQAFSYGKEALHLRRKLLKRKFKLTSAETGKESQHRNQGLVSLEAWGPTIAEIWPDFGRSGSKRDSFLTPWNVLRCYLESTLQVALMNELIGDGAEAEFLLRTGKEISIFHGLTVFCVAFTSLLGQLYRKRHLWDDAERELKYARDIVENEAAMSCKPCKLTLEISVDMQVGDLFWSLFEKDFQKQSAANMSSALGMYQSALEKLNSSRLEFLAGSCNSHKTVSQLCCNDCVALTEHEVSNLGKEPLALKGRVLPSCHICVLLRQSSIGQCNEPTVPKGRTKNSRNAEAGPTFDVKAKRASTRLAKEQNMEINTRTRTRSKRIANVTADNGISRNDDLPADVLTRGKANYLPNGVDCSKDDICSMFGCWNCLLVKSLNSGCIQNILQFRWDCVRRRYLVSLLLKTARVSGAHKGHFGAHEVHSVYWQCISLLYFRSLPQDSYKFYGPYLVKAIMDESIGDFLPLERAEILYSMSFYLLKGIISEQSRDVCCSFSSVEMSDGVPWLLKAFVLSRESPLLLQQVCRLLACIFLLSTVDASIQLPLFSKGSLSLNHWVAYFHQISVGTHLNCQYLATLQVLPSENISKVSLVETDDNVSKLHRFPSVDVLHIEKYITEFFTKLPDIPIICISVFGDDYVNVLGESLLLPSSFPAWMLLSRFDSTCKPTTMLLPVDAIPEEIQPEDPSIKDLGNPTRVLDKKWQCPWGYSITDSVAPSFRNILEENFISLSSATLTINDVKANHVQWWSHRMKLNNYLDNFLKDIEESWLGPWKCLLLGRQLGDQHIDPASSSIIAGLEKQFKLEINPALIKAILGGGVSLDEVQECVYQLILYKGYFGRGGCCGKDRLRAFSSRHVVDKALETLRYLIKDAAEELPEPVQRDPVIFVLDTNVQMLPLENLPVLRNQEIYRMPSVGSILFALTRSSDHYKDDVIGSPFPAIDPFNTFYLLNPSGDLSSTQKEFDQLFRNYEWKGKAGSGDPIKAEELILALTNHDLFLYFGHGSGTQYVSGKDIEKLDNCAAALLMGCSSGTLHCKGSYAPRGAPLSYLSAGSPAVIANLWDVSDKDIDRFSKALLESWLQENFADDNNCSQCCQLTQELEAMNIAAKDNGRTRRKGTRGKKSKQITDSTNCCSCRRRRIATYLSEARRACRLPLLIGASPVCYGVPTIIRKK